MSISFHLMKEDEKKDVVNNWHPQEGEIEQGEGGVFLVTDCPNTHGQYEIVHKRVVWDAPAAIREEGK